MTGLDKAHQARRADSTIKRARVSHAIHLAVARGEVPTISKISRTAQVDRSIFYGPRGAPLRAELDLAVAQMRVALDSSTSAEARVTTAALRADLANANQLITRLRQQVTILEQRLSHHMGEEILNQMPAQRRAAVLADHSLQANVDTLVSRVSELEQANQELEEQLDAARRALRDLTRQVNSNPELAFLDPET